MRLGERNAMLEMEIHDSETRYMELYDEYTQMNIDMEEL